LFTVICGPCLFSAFVIINTISWWLMISLITLGLFLYAPSLRRFPPSSLPPRFWAESLHTATYLLNRVPSTASPAPTPHHTLFGTPPRYDHLCVFACACYFNITATLTSWRSARHVVCFSVTPLTTRGTVASTSPLAESSSPNTLCSTSQIYPTPLLLILSWRLCFLTRWFSHLFLFSPFPQVFPVHHRLRCPLLRHAWPRCLLLRHTRPRHRLLCHARSWCLLPRHLRPLHPLSRHARPRYPLHAKPSRCRCTDVVRCRH
jgi:hypothetical protein